MQGYKSFRLGSKIRKWVTEAGYIFFAPNSYALEDRPTYNIVAPHNFLEKIHEFNLAEIDLFVKKLDELSFIDRDKMFLVGYSEGGVATARYSGVEFLGRVVLGWSCEANFFTNYPQIGAQLDDPFLNIIGRDDELFGKQSPLNRGYRVTGNCADALFKFTNAKVVILPNTTHNLLKNPFLKDEILNFLNRYKDIKSEKKAKKK
jgi:pimeloyl-ACP methyl ester carboxylesterase